MINPAELDLKEEVVIRVTRVSKVTSRGKNFRFGALVVVGDGAGHVGIGQGKAGEVMSAINKGKEDAKQNIIKIPDMKKIRGELSEYIYCCIYNIYTVGFFLRGHRPGL